MNRSTPKVCITGIGVVSPVGIGRDHFWDALKSGVSGIKPVTLFDTANLRSKMAGEISDFKPEAILGEKGLRNLDRTTLLALCAAKLALNDAQLSIDSNNADTTGVVLGSTMGSVCSTSEFDKQALREGPRSVNPGLFPNTVINSPASHVSIHFGIKGFNTTISSGFSSSLDAIDYARNQILFGRARSVLVGGAEELCEHIYKVFHRMGILSASATQGDEVSCPYDRRRNGLVLGEGAAFFMLEHEEEAARRSAKIYGYIGGSGSQFDRRSINRYDPKNRSGKMSMLNAIDDAGITPDDIDCIVSSANSSVSGDLAEAMAINEVFGADRRSLLVPAYKANTGETFSASGALGLAEALYILNNSFVPPTINHLFRDDRCQVNCVPNLGLESKVKSVMINTFGMTGKNASLIINSGEIDD